MNNSYLLNDINIDDFILENNNLNINNEDNLYKESKDQKVLREHCEHILSEAYFGKHPLLRDCELQLKSIIKSVRTKPLYIATDSKENLKICRNLEKLFNVESCSIIWSADLNLNACTYPISNMLQFSNSLETVRSSTGVQFKSSKGLHLMIHVTNGTIILNEDLTEQELMAILLHEIGHNFYNTDYMVFMNKYIQTISVLSHLSKKIKEQDLTDQEVLFILNKFSITRKLINTATQKNQNTSSIIKIVSIINTLFKIIVSLNTFALRVKFVLDKNIFTNLFTMVKNGVTTLPTALAINLAFKQQEQERFSDTFASMYGYSNEIVSTRIRFEQTKNMALDLNLASKIPPLYYFLNFVDSIATMPFKLATQYDNGLTSSRAQMDYLEKELNKTGYNEKLKKEIRTKIAELKELEQVALSKEHNLKTANIFRIVLTPLLDKFNINLNVNSALNKTTYIATGREYDSSFEDVLDKKQTI